MRSKGGGVPLARVRATQLERADTGAQLFIQSTSGDIILKRGTGYDEAEDTWAVWADYTK